MTGSAALLVFDGYADWEPALALAELRRTFGVKTLALGFSRDPVRTMGGLCVTPDLSLDEFDPARAGLLIVPGGNALMGDVAPELHAILRDMAKRGNIVAGICAGVLPLARAGLLDTRAHTASGPEYLASNAPGYAGRERFTFAPCVSDQGVITATGVAPVAFAREIFLAVSPGKRTGHHALHRALCRGIRIRRRRRRRPPLPARLLTAIEKSASEVFKPALWKRGPTDFFVRLANVTIVQRFLHAKPPATGQNHLKITLPHRIAKAIWWKTTVLH